MTAWFDRDIDPAPLAGRRVAVIGFGNQGRAQALNLADSGIEVVVGLRANSPRRAEAEAEGLRVLPPDEAAAEAALTMLLAPDEQLGAIYRQIEPALAPGSAIGFSHGFALRFGTIAPRADLDVIMVAPKGPGRALRSLYREGRGMVALFAAHRDSSGGARALALAYGRALGCGRAGLIESSIAEECEADLFNEQAVVWGAVPEILTAGFDTLVGAGVAPEVAYLECVGELRLLADLIEARGLAGMREAISNTAELGAVLGGPAVIDEGVRARMRAQFETIRSGAFAAALAAEAAGDYPLLRRARAEARAKPIEAARDRLATLAPPPSDAPETP